MAVHWCAAGIAGGYNHAVVREIPPVVLVVEDDTAVRQPLVKFLQMRQYTVVTAETADEGLDTLPVYRDLDDDGYGDPDREDEACALEAGWVTVAKDCDDQHPEINPDATALCDGLDNDCDGYTDGEDATVTET